MKKFRWQLIIIFLTGLVVGILLLSEQPSAVAPVSPTPISGGIYTEGLIGSFLRLNPILDTTNSADQDIDRLIFSRLIKFDDRGLPQADLAESWGVSRDGTIYNVTLRQNAFWHDGKPVTSDDIAFTVDLIRKGGSTIPADLQAFWKDVEVVVLSDTALQFKLPEAFAPFPDYLTFGILPKHILDGKSIDDVVNDPFNMKPIGSGPYQFDRLVVEDNKITGVVLKVAEKYYGQKPYLETIVFHYFADGQSAWQAYQDGSIQGISRISPDILNNVLSDPKLAVYTGRLPQLSMILINLNNPKAPFFQDVNVRHALLAGLNRQMIIDRVLNGQAVVADGVIFPGTWAYYDTSFDEFDKVQAGKLFDQAGYKLGTDAGSLRKNKDTNLTFTMIYPQDEQHRVVAEEIQREWESLGMKVDLEAVPYDELVNKRLADRDYMAALVDLNMSHSPDPDPYPFWDQAQTPNGQNYSQWDNRMASEFLEQARITVDLTERTRYYRNFQALFAQELPSIPLYYPQYTYAVTRDVQGIRIGPLFDTSDRFATVQDWFLLSQRKGQQPSTPTSTPAK